MALALVCLPFLMLGQEARGEDLLSIVRARHRAARESIRTFSANVVTEMTYPKKQLFRRGKYWRSFNTVRVQEYPSDSALEDILVKGSETRHIGRGRIGENKYSYGAGRHSSADMFCICDAWLDMLIEFTGPSATRYDYDCFLDLAKSPPRVSRETLDGHECIRVSMKYDTDTGEEWSKTFWHDPNYNYLIRKAVATFPDKNMPCEYEILEFREAAPGVFVPLCRRSRQYDHGKLQTENITTLSNVHVNEEIAPSVLALPSIPAGTILDDRIEGTKYPIDENWKRIGPATPLQLTPALARSSRPASDYHAQSREEPPSLAKWMLIASLAVLAAAGAYRFYERRRARQVQTARAKGG